MSNKTTLQIGELARRTGVTVRTLRYYDQINLLSPVSTTTSGYRLYSRLEVTRLQQIRSLQQLGFSLGAIKQCLDKDNLSVIDVLKMHSKQMQQQLQQLTQFCDRLDMVMKRVGESSSISVNLFLDLIKETTMFDEYYTAEQLQHLQERREQLGESRMKQVEQQWHDLIAAVKFEQQNGSDPASASMQALAIEWQSLISEFTGGDLGIRASLEKVNREKPSIMQQQGYSLDKELMEYIGAAMKIVKE